MPGSRIARTACLLWAVSWPAAAFAYRPFDSTDAAVTNESEMEVELGPVGYLARGSDRALVVPSLILNWGFARGWEAVLQGSHLVELGSDVEAPRLRVEDTFLSLKSVLREGSLQGKAGPSVATELSALLPTFEERGVGAEAALIVSQRWRDLTLHLNGAPLWTPAHRLGAFGGLIIEVHDTWAVRPVAEVFVEGERHRPTTVSGLVGAIWRASDTLSFDAAVRVANAGGFRTTEVRVGLTWAFRVGFPA